MDTEAGSWESWERTWSKAPAWHGECKNTAAHGILAGLTGKGDVHGVCELGKGLAGAAGIVRGVLQTRRRLHLSWSDLGGERGFRAGLCSKWFLVRRIWGVKIRATIKHMQQ